VDGLRVPRCQVERLMRAAGLRGALRGRRPPTTTRPDPAAVRAPDLVERDFSAATPNQLWLVDFTYVPTWSGMAFTGFVADACSRRIVGWRTAASMPTELPLDALEMALWTRQRAGQHVDGVIHHSDAGSQRGFNWSSQHPDEKGCVDGTASGMDDDGDGAAGDAVAGQAAGPPRCGALVLGEDRGGADQRGRRCRVRRVGTGRFAMVPGTRRHAFDRPRSVVGQVSVVR
jgi:putative transposase